MHAFHPGRISSLQALISRNYRGDVDMGVIDKFLPMVLDSEEEGAIVPILVHEKVTFVYIKYNNLYRILVISMYVRREGLVVYRWRL